MPLRVLFTILLLVAALPAADPVRLIFDTDIGNDVDDALALAVIHAMQSRGEAQLLAVSITKDSKSAAPYIDLVNTFYKRPGIPIGIVKGGKTTDDTPMIRIPAEHKTDAGGFLYPHRITDSASAPDAVAVLRDALTAAADQSVVIAQVGFSTNLARLLASPGGAALAARKVRLLSVMAGHFPQGNPEYNVKTDIPSARAVFDSWPSPIVFSGFEIGQALLFPAVSIERDFGWTTNHPVVDAYRAYMKMPYDRPTWDLTSVLYAVRPDRDYFSLSAPGRVTVDDQGRTMFTPGGEGKHRYLVLNEKQKVRTLEALIFLASQP